MKKKFIIKYMLLMVLLLTAATAWFGTKQVAGAVQKLKSIEATYLGTAVEVGKEIDLKDIYLMAEYIIQEGDWSYTDFGEVKSGFTISPTVIKKSGQNRIIVTYQDKTCALLIEGKVVEELSAAYLGDDLYIGTEIPAGKIEVYAYFSDGSYEQVKEFTLVEKKVTKEGINTIRVKYGGKTAEVEVYGKPPLAVDEIYAEYVGESIIVGNSINKTDFKVTAHYNDGTTKEVTNFNISPAVVKKVGDNIITVSYGNVTTKVEIQGDERIITKMKAEYTGGGVLVGRKVKREEIEVIVTYNDGTEEQIENYRMLGELIQYEGENVVLVYLESFMEEIIVPGVKGFAADYDNAITASFAGPGYVHNTKVTLGMNMNVGRGKFFLKEADPDIVDFAVRRIVPTKNYIGFQLRYQDDEMVREFPMAMKVTVPKEFDPEKFAVYYKEDQSNTMAKVIGDFINEEKTEYEFVVYQPGTYILVNEVANRLVSEIVVETELELKENRSFSLNPVVFPLTAENRDLTYSSTDESVATVSENGKIRTYSEGTCEIWIETQDDSGVYAVVTVEVTGRKKRK